MNSSNSSFKSIALSMASCSLLGSGLTELTFAQACLAQDGSSGSSSGCIDWSKLELSPQQSNQVQQLEQQWYKESGEILPQIREEQLKLQKLLAEHNPDSMQIVGLQQSIARRKEQLNLAAMQNYLSKKKLLNDKQQLQFEQMIQQNMTKRRMQLYPGSQTEPMPDKIQMLMQRVKNIFPMDKGNP